MPLRTTCTINLSVPVELAEALDCEVIRRQRLDPWNVITRSAVAAEAIRGLLSKQESEHQPAPRRRTR